LILIIIKKNEFNKKIISNNKIKLKLMEPNIIHINNISKKLNIKIDIKKGIVEI
tara:strand:- start:1179 stop:1340 length:162 start_codon:yes stop_codon:yes gene_type:complete